MNKIILFIVIFLISSSLFSQSSVGSGTDLDRTKPPKIEQTKPFAFPKYENKSLPNGLEIALIENHSQPTLSMIIYIKGGAYLDGKKSGLANIVTELLTKGTKKRIAKEIAEELDYLGATYSLNTSWDNIAIRISVLKKYWKDALDIISDCIINPVFKDDEIKKILELRLDEIKSDKSDPNYLADVKFDEAVFPGHPYGMPLKGTEKSIPKINKSDLLDFHKKVFKSSNCFITLIGDITMEESIRVLEEKFGKWEKGEKIIYQEKKVNSEKKYKVFIVDRPGAVQSSLRVGKIGASKYNPDVFGLSYINTYLGGYFRAQLNLNLREKNGYTYGASSYFDNRKFPGPFIISTEVGTSITHKAIEEIFNEIDSLYNRLLSDERVDEVRNFVLGSFPIQLQSLLQLASLVCNLENYGLSPDYYDRFFNFVKNITKNSIRELAKKYFNKDQFLIVVSGDSKKIYKDLERFGKIEVCDSNGKKINIK